MRRAKVIRSVLYGWSGRVLLALLLAGALLLCHGLYGASHQVLATLHAEHASHAHMPHADTHGAGVGEQSQVESHVDHQGGDGEGQLGHVAYAAALLVISLGAVLWLLSGGSTWTRGVLFSLPMRVVPQGYLLPSRRPSPTLLQVFRL
jgi:hypothetical protein